MEIIAALQKNWATVPVTSTDASLSPKWELMNVDTLAHLVWHGLKQKLNDPNGAKDLTDSEKNGNSRKVLDSIEANEVRMQSGRTADPIESEYMRMARADLCNRLVAKGYKLKSFTMAQINEKTVAMLSKYPEHAAQLLATATATVTARKEALESAKATIIEVD